MTDDGCIDAWEVIADGERICTCYRMEQAASVAAGWIRAGTAVIEVRRFRRPAERSHLVVRP